MQKPLGMKKLQQNDFELDPDNEDFTEFGNPSEAGSEILPIELTDETITQEMINELKMLGEYKPPGVSWERWQRIQDIRPEHEHMIHLAASGVPHWRIAQTLGYDNASVSKILNTPAVRDRVKQEIESIYGADHKKALKDRALKAIKVVDDVLETGKESEQASMAKWVLEHSVGKASQDIQVTKTTLSEVIFKLDQMSADQLRDVTGNLEGLSKPKDHFDNIIEQIIPQGMVVGKRSGGESEEQS